MGLHEMVAISLCLNITCPQENVTSSVITVLNDTSEDMHTQTALDSRIRIDVLAKLLKGKHLRITTVQNPPLSYTVMENYTRIGKGIAFDCINFIRDKYDFTYSVVMPEEDFLGTVGNDSVFQMLAHNKADIAAAFLPVVPRFWQYISYSTNLDVGEFVVIMKRPKESATGSGLLAPFTTPVWLLIILSLLVVGPLIHFIIFLRAKLCKDDESKIYSLQSCMWFVYGALLKQGTTLSPTTDSSRLLFATWWIFITILTAYYTANLTAFLTLSRFTLPINAPGDIAQKGYTWVTIEGSTVKTYNDEQDRRTQNKLLPTKQARYLKLNDEEILETYVKRGNAMYVREKTIVNHLMYQDYLKKTKQGIAEEERCTFVVTTFSIFHVARAFGYSRQFAFRELFDNSLQHLVQSGVLNHMNERGLPDTKICPLNLGSKERRLKNADLFMTYVIVAAGFVISLTVFLIEYFYRKWHSTRAVNRRVKLMRLFDKVMIPIKRINDDYSHNNNNHNNSGFIDFAQNGGTERRLLPPPPYHSLFRPPFAYSPNGKRKHINGREYWVVESKNGDATLVPVRQPSALLFHYTN